MGVITLTSHPLPQVTGAAPPELARATVSTLRRKLFTIPGRLVRSARRLHMRPPHNWPWETALLKALITALPMRR